MLTSKEQHKISFKNRLDLNHNQKRQVLENHLERIFSVIRKREDKDINIMVDFSNQQISMLKEMASKSKIANLAMIRSRVHFLSIF